jgi:DNA-directed RNA polymerase subunit RPC12/RpoP
MSATCLDCGQTYAELWPDGRCTDCGIREDQEQDEARIAMEAEAPDA